MTKVLEIVDLAETGQLQLSLKRDGDCRTAPAVAFRHPLEASDQQEVGWYFQEFLDDPFGPARVRAEAVETGLRNLGRLLFEVAFQGNEEARNCYTEAASDGLTQYQLPR